MRYRNTPILDVKQHPALKTETEIAVSPEWQERETARWLGMQYETQWWPQPRWLKVNQVAEWRVHNRVQVFQRWEQQQQAKRDAEAKARNRQRARPRRTRR